MRATMTPLPSYRGSGATGFAYKDGMPFGPHSDYDIALVSPKLMEKAGRIRVQM